MGKIEQVLRAEIGRLSRKEVRASCGPLGKQVVELRRRVSKLTRTVEALTKAVERLAKPSGRRTPKADAAPPAAAATKARLSPGLIRKLRARLGLTQAQFATLLGVSAATVAFWEQGRNRPTAESKAAIVALRGLGRREARQLLEAKAPASP